jgi:hypothetical protein
MVVDKRSVKYWIWLAAQIVKKVKDLSITAALKIKALFSKKSIKPKSSKPVESIEDDVQAWLDNIKSNQPKKSALALKEPAKSQSTSKSTTSAPKNAKKSGSKGKSRSKA